MPGWSINLQRRAVCAVLACCLGWHVSHAVTPNVDLSALLEQTDALQVTDHARSLQQLALLNREAARLTPDQQWHLRYLDAWEAMYESDYPKSETLLQDIIRHSGNPVWADRASASLLWQLVLTRRYPEAFELTGRLAARLPKVTNVEVRRSMLLNLSQSLALAGQVDLAVRYARMALAEAPEGKDACYSASTLVVALSIGDRLTLDSPELQQAIHVCTVAKVPVFSTDLQQTVVDLYLHAGQPRKALALLDRIAPAVEADGYTPNKLQTTVLQARALAAIGDDDAARKAALAIVAMQKTGDWPRDAYEVLYRIEKKQGHTAAALDYYEKYVALDKAYLDDVNVRTVAYETVQQHVLLQKLETESLSRQNALLRMRQTLDAKTAETNRLYLALLLMALVSAALWMFRLKRSQLRFKKLSHLDGLTAIFNRQHFMSEVERTLRLLERRAGTACLVFIDLDHFKHINDTYGHAVGDDVLRQVVVASKQHLRPVDLFGRLGGEEFGILLVECTRTQSMVIADRIRLAIEETRVEDDGVVVGVSASAGLSFTDACGHDLQRLCKEADAALYRAKRGGRNRVVAGAEYGCPVEA